MYTRTDNSNRTKTEENYINRANHADDPLIGAAMFLNRLNRSLNNLQIQRNKETGTQTSEDTKSEEKLSEIQKTLKERPLDCLRLVLERIPKKTIVLELRKAIRKNTFLNSAFHSSQSIDKLLDAMNVQLFEKNKTIYTQGGDDSDLFISFIGKYKITADKNEKYFQDIRVFGELPCLYNIKNKETITTLSPAVVYRLNEAIFRRIRLEVKNSENFLEAFLTQHARNISEYFDHMIDISKLTNGMVEWKYFHSNEEIISVFSDNGRDKMYVVKAGAVAKKSKHIGIVEGHLRIGECFGSTFVGPQLNKFSYVASESGAECMVLDKENLLKILKTPLPTSDFEFRRYTLKSFECVKNLGRGGFNTIALAHYWYVNPDERHKEQNGISQKEEEVPKILKKVAIKLVRDFEPHRLQMRCHSNFIVRPHMVIERGLCYFMVTEYCSGGDIFEKKLKENQAKFIAACVLEAMCYLENKKIVHNNIRADHVLLDSKGYAKLTGFGRATYSRNVEEVAPDHVRFIRNNSQATLDKGRDLDFFMFGCFIYELLSGKSAIEDTRDYDDIRMRHVKLKGPKDMLNPIPAKDIINELCNGEPSERLGVREPSGAQSIKAHDWFLDIDFFRLKKMEIDSPLKKNILPLNHCNFNIVNRFFRRKASPERGNNTSESETG